MVHMCVCVILNVKGHLLQHIPWMTEVFLVPGAMVGKSDPDISSTSIPPFASPYLKILWLSPKFMAFASYHRLKVKSLILNQVSRHAQSTRVLPLELASFNDMLDWDYTKFIYAKLES